MNVAKWTSRILLNALIGFTKADPAWPNPFGDCGWRVSMIEPSWFVEVPGSQQPGRIRPDLVLALRAGEELLLLECKVGTIQKDQLTRYGYATATKIRDQSHERPITAIQIVYVGTEPHRTSCLSSLGDTGTPLINFSDDEARLVLGDLNEPCADGQFKAGVPLRGRPPTQYIPLVDDSALDETVPVVLRALMDLALDDIRLFDKRTVVERIFGDMFQSLHPSSKSDLEKPVGKALNALAQKARIGDVLTGSGNSWALTPDFGKSGGMQFKTAARRITDQMASITEQQSLDV